MKFEWDENKNLENIKKHGVDFNDVKDIFNDENLLVAEDDTMEYGELRLRAIGVTALTGITYVVYTERHENTARFISARPATKRESRVYRANRSW
jgi:uncharacterized DUF497 family protein